MGAEGVGRQSIRFLFIPQNESAPRPLRILYVDRAFDQRAYYSVRFWGRLVLPKAKRETEWTVWERA
jgi:hypothetical protein